MVSPSPVPLEDHWLLICSLPQIQGFIYLSICLVQVLINAWILHMMMTVQVSAPVRSRDKLHHGLEDPDLCVHRQLRGFPDILQLVESCPRLTNPHFDICPTQLVHITAKTDEAFHLLTF